MCTSREQLYSLFNAANVVRPPLMGSGAQLLCEAWPQVRRPLRARSAEHRPARGLYGDAEDAPIIGHHSRTTSEQQLVEYAVLPSEIEQLPDLAGFLKFASRPAWMQVRFPIAPA